MEDNVINHVEIKEETDHHETNSIVEEAYIQQLEVIEKEVVSQDVSFKEKTSEETDLTAEQKGYLRSNKAIYGRRRTL